MSVMRVGHHGPLIFQGESQIDSSKKVPWYNANVTAISPMGRQLLESYSQIAPPDVLPHVLSIRDRAFTIWPYACIGQVRFLDYTIPHHPYCDPVLSKLRSGGHFLDAGSCFGQVIRFLAHNEGIPGSQLHAFDLEPAFTDFGFELFRDKDRLSAHMFSGDLLADPSTPSGMSTVEGKMDVIHVASVLHSWQWDEQIFAAKRLVSLTKPVAGSLIVGNQLGSLNAGEYAMPTGKGYNYRHDEASMRRFWGQVGEETGSDWKIDSGLFLPPAVKENLEQSWAKNDPGMRMIWFMASRLS